MSVYAKRQTNNENYEITLENIDLLSEKTTSFLSDLGMDSRNVLRLRISLEEVLLSWKDGLTINEKEPIAQFSIGKRLAHPYIILSASGERVNPFEKNDDILDDAASRNILANIGLAFQYEYVNGVNRVILMPPKVKTSMIKQIILSVVFALALGGLLSLLPENYGTFISKDMLTPIFSTFMGFLSAVAGPLIFLSVLWGIYSIGDVATLGSIGKKLIFRFIIMTLVSIVLGLACCIWFFPLSASESTAGGNGIFEIFNMIMNIVPSNLIKPFAEGNNLQIIFIAIVFSLAILILDRKVSEVTKLIDQANIIVQFVMGAICNLMPYFIFISILNMILSGMLVRMLSSIKLLGLYVMCSIVIFAVYIFIFCLRRHVSPVIFIKKLLPIFVIGIATASSSAAFATETDTCIKRIGIDKRVVDFGVPLGNVLFKAGTAVYFLILGLFMADTYGVKINITFIIMLIIMSTMLAIAAPPIPGGAITCYTILFAQLQIPKEALALAITFDVVADFITTAMNLTYLQIELADVSFELDMINMNILKKDISGQ